jgi:putative NADH-flavin reductase
MKLTIFAATGGIGRHILEQAVAAGHDVTAAVRNPKSLPPTVRAVTIDLATADAAALEQVVAGADAVLSGLGARVGSEIGVARQGTQAIVNAMKRTEVRRLVVVSAAPIANVPSPGRPTPPKHDPGDGFFMRHLFNPFARTVFKQRYADLALMEDVLRDSGLDWSIVRPPRLTDKPLSGRYRVAYGQNLRGGFVTSRANVAHLMLRVLGQPETIRQTVGIAD